MSDMPTGPAMAGAGDDLTEEQRAFLLARQAAQAATSPSPAADAAAAAAQMTERGPALPAESEMDQMMAMLRAQSEQIAVLTAQVGVMQKQAEEAVAAAGGPLVIRYAQAAADKLAATVVAHPDLARDHFDEPKAAAADLVAAATELSRQGGSADAVNAAAARLDRWFDRTHPRVGRKHIDFSALRDDVETTVDEAAKLAA